MTLDMEGVPDRLDWGLVREPLMHYNTVEELGTLDQRKGGIVLQTHPQKLSG